MRINPVRGSVRDTRPRRFDLRSHAPSSLSADVCVVGSGAVGLSLAVALARDGADVLVLEGGGATLEATSQDLQQGESIGHPFHNIGVGRYRVLGGTTVFWGGQLSPFDDFVVGARPWLGQAAWPLPPHELAHWHEQTWALLGLGDALLDDAALWRATRLHLPALGDDLELMATRWVKTRNFARLFRSQMRAPGGPSLVLHANVVALQTDAARQRIEAVHARSLDGRSLVVRARRFVLANGSLEIPRLLLHPLSDGRHAPWSASRWLGTPLVDHLDSHAADVEVLDHDRFHDLFDNLFHDGRMYMPKLRLAPTTQRREGLVDAGAAFFYRTRYSEHLLYLKQFLRSVREGSGDVSVRELPQHLQAVLKLAAPLALRYLRDRRSFKPRDAEVGLMVFCEQLPTPRSRIALADQVDALGQRRLRVDWQIDGRELATMRRFAVAVGEALERLKLARVRVHPDLLAGSPAFLSRVKDGVHQMGTARIGASPEQGVVDIDLRVHGSDNLYVAGAAVFPSTGHANPTFTAIALGQRLAAHLGRPC